MLEFRAIMRVILLAAGLVLVSLAQSRAADLPIAPYEEVKGWGPAGAGSLEWEPAGMEADANGNVYLLRRSEPNLVIVDVTGKKVRTMATPSMVWAHGLHVDRGGNIWATDCAVGSPSKDLQPRYQPAIDAHHGYQVFKFSPQGTLLLTLGTAGEQGDGPTHYSCPTDVVTAADGSIFVADGHDGGAAGRILKYASDGTLIKTWGKPGKGPGEFAAPHALAVDSRGRLLVGDRGNKRIQVFDQEGNFLEQFTEFGGPAGIAITADDTMFVTDNARKIVIVGSARTGKATGIIPDIFAEPIAADNAGNVYVGEVHPHTWRKFSLKK